MSAAPLLSCAQVRIDLGGVPLVERLSLETRARRVAVLGAASSLFRLLSGQAVLAAGELLLAGSSPRRLAERGELGIALGDSELPAEWRADEYLEQAARLSGLPRAEARARAGRLLGAWGLGTLGSRRCRELVPAEQRVLLLAQALVASPRVLAASDLFGGLEPSGQRFVADRLALALSDGSAGGFLLGIEGLVPDQVEREVLGTLDEVVVIQQGGLLCQGEPRALFGAARRYRVTVLSAAEALVQRLAGRGVQVAPRTGALAAYAEQLVVELPDGTPPEAILEESLGAGAVVLELVPLSGPAGP